MPRHSMPRRGYCSFLFGRNRRSRKLQPHPGASLTWNALSCVAQLDLAPMLLKDAAHDREPEPGSFLARCHVGLEQPAAVLLRQPDPVVDDVDVDRSEEHTSELQSLRHLVCR